MTGADLERIRARAERFRYTAGVAEESPDNSVTSYALLAAAVLSAEDVPTLLAEVARLQSAIGAVLGTVAEMDNNAWSKLGHRAMGTEFPIWPWRDAPDHSTGRRLIVAAYGLGAADCAAKLRDAL